MRTSTQVIFPQSDQSPKPVRCFFWGPVLNHWEKTRGTLVFDFRFTPPNKNRTGPRKAAAHPGTLRCHSKTTPSKSWATTRAGGQNPPRHKAKYLPSSTRPPALARLHRSGRSCRVSPKAVALTLSTMDNLTFRSAGLDPVPKRTPGLGQPSMWHIQVSQYCTKNLILVSRNFCSALAVDTKFGCSVRGSGPTLANWMTLEGASQENYPRAKPREIMDIRGKYPSPIQPLEFTW